MESSATNWGEDLTPIDSIIDLYFMYFVVTIEFERQRYLNHDGLRKEPDHSSGLMNSGVHTNHF